MQPAATRYQSLSPPARVLPIRNTASILNRSVGDTGLFINVSPACNLIDRQCESLDAAQTKLNDVVWQVWGRRRHGHYGALQPSAGEGEPPLMQMTINGASSVITKLKMSCSSHLI